MRQSIQFGAGNIGRGFIGALLRQSGYEVVFADINTQIVDALEKHGGYTVFITDNQPDSFTIDSVSALNTSDPLLADKISNSELLTTAVGLPVLPKIAPVIAKGIAKRAEKKKAAYLNIIACENGIRATSELKKEVFSLLSAEDKEYCEKWVGFVDCSVDRIVPPVKTDNLADVCVERFYEWNIDASQVKGELPIVGINRVENLSAYIERKLFTLNTGHATIAYLGYLKGFNTIEESVADPAILKIARGAMSESGAALVQKFGFDSAEHAAYREKIIQRFRNPYLNDKVTRVGRDPMRKLSANDRFISPLVTAHGYGLATENLLAGIGAALHFENKQDPQSKLMQEMIREKGLPVAIEKITGIHIDSTLNLKIANAYNSCTSVRK